MKQTLSTCVSYRLTLFLSCWDFTLLREVNVDRTVPNYRCVKKIDTVVQMPEISVFMGGWYGWNRNFLHVYHIEWHCSCPVKILSYKGSFYSDRTVPYYRCVKKLTQLCHCQRFPLLCEVYSHGTEIFYMCIVWNDTVLVLSGFYVIEGALFGYNAILQVCQNKLTQLRQCWRFAFLKEVVTDETETFFMCMI